MKLPFLTNPKSVYANISQDDNGQSIIKNGRRITVNNTEYIETDILTGEIIREVIINQNENGIDVEDRIEKCRTVLLENGDVTITLSLG